MLRTLYASRPRPVHSISRASVLDEHPLDRGLRPRSRSERAQSIFGPSVHLRSLRCASCPYEQWSENNADARPAGAKDWHRYTRTLAAPRNFLLFLFFIIRRAIACVKSGTWATCGRSSHKECFNMF